MPPLSASMKEKSGPVLASVSAGIGARAPHFDAIIADKPAVGFLELHSENFFTAGGPQIVYLEKMRALYPISLHGVGLSLGSADGVNAEHLQKLKALVDRVSPVLLSEHLSWSGTGGIFLPDLLPLPMTVEALDLIAENVSKTQDFIGRQILIENPSAYLSFVEQEMTEPEFLSALVQKTGCGLLLDVNNIHVSAHNTGLDLSTYFDLLPKDAVHEIHLAGYQVNVVEGQDVFIDAHNRPVYPAVWDLYEKALAHFGDTATLIEWDSDLPPLSGLVAEAEKANDIRQRLFSKVKHAVAC